MCPGPVHFSLKAPDLVFFGLVVEKETVPVSVPLVVVKDSSPVVPVSEYVA